MRIGIDARELCGRATGVGRYLSGLIAEDGSPVPKKLAIKIEETIGELLEAIEN